MTDALAKAHVARALAASLLVDGSTEPKVLDAYAQALLTARLLGEISQDGMETAMMIARSVFAANLHPALAPGQMSKASCLPEPLKDLL